MKAAIMKKHRPKLLTSRSKGHGKKAPRPQQISIRETNAETVSLDSVSSDVMVTSRDALLSPEDAESDTGYDVYEADSENEDGSEEDVDSDEGYLFAAGNRKESAELKAALVVDVEDDDSDEDMRMCMRIHEETGKMYSRISGEDRDFPTLHTRLSDEERDPPSICSRISDDSPEYPRMYSRFLGEDTNVNIQSHRIPDTARDLAKINGHTDQVMLQYIMDKQLKPLAPPLNANRQFHVFFLYHQSDREWTANVMERLEAPPLGFLCCCHDRDFDVRVSLRGSTHLGMKSAQKTVMVLGPEFISDVWCHADLQLLSEMDVLLVQKDLILVLLHDCDIPHVLSEVACIDVTSDDWWGKLLALLISSEETPMTEETALSLSSSLVGLNPHLQSGHLLHSAKSRCRCCGKEVIDPTEVPDELIAHGIQIPPDEYNEAIGHLMKDHKFKCHVWCYNVPAAMLFFTLLLALCLSVIPVIEAKLIFHGAETGLEFVHAGIAWLCALTLYMVVMQISKRRMKGTTYKKLTFVNTILIKYNLLAGVENLGLADCNKYYLHFFYFEIGPCLAYLQELMVNIEEYSSCFRNQTSETADVTIDMSCDESIANSNDTSRVLTNGNLSNITMQTQAEDLILQHSGEYISMLITKRLDYPRRQRHIKDSPCLCQFVEQRVYKMIV